MNLKARILTDHTPECYEVAEDNGWLSPWWLSGIKFLRRDRTGRRNPNTANYFLVFSCNLASIHECRAEAILLDWDVVRAALVDPE